MESDHPERHGFSLRYQDGQAVLFLLPEDKRTRPVYADDITARMKILGIPPVPARRIRDIIENGGGEPTALVEWPAGAQLSARVVVKVREDNMLAEAVVEAPRPGGAPVDRKMVAAAMALEGITTGIDQRAIRILLRGDSPANGIVIAGGKVPVIRYL